jgi:hypothetical protein
MRKPIQIAISGEPTPTTMFALCDDGTIWSHWMQGRTEEHRAWQRIHLIPQDEEAAELAPNQEDQSMTTELSHDTIDLRDKAEAWFTAERCDYNNEVSLTVGYTHDGAQYRFIAMRCTRAQWDQFLRDAGAIVCPNPMPNLP